MVSWLSIGQCLSLFTVRLQIQPVYDPSSTQVLFAKFDSLPNPICNFLVVPLSHFRPIHHPSSLVRCVSLPLHNSLDLSRNSSIHFDSPAPARGAAAGAKPAQHPVVEKYGTLIGNFVKANYDRAMFFVAYSEVAILIWTILKAIT
jgi:hypothetical protein